MPLLTPLAADERQQGRRRGAHRPPDRRMDLLTGELTEVLALWAAGAITPRIDATYPFEGAADAHRRILAHGNTGKIVLIP